MNCLFGPDKIVLYILVGCKKASRNFCGYIWCFELLYFRATLFMEILEPIIALEAICVRKKIM